MFNLASLTEKKFSFVLCCSFVAFLLGISLPMFSLEKLFFLQDKFSLLGGVTQLLLKGDYFLFVIVFGFSVMAPLFKYYLLWKIRGLRCVPTEQTLKIARQLSVIGKWSMADVFVLAILAATVKLGGLASVTVYVGVLFFSLSVFSAMYLSHIATLGYELTLKEIPKTRSDEI